jgi:hypothetical protein
MPPSRRTAVIATATSYPLVFDIAELDLPKVPEGTHVTTPRG